LRTFSAQQALSTSNSLVHGQSSTRFRRPCCSTGAAASWGAAWTSRQWSFFRHALSGWRETWQPNWPVFQAHAAHQWTPKPTGSQKTCAQGTSWTRCGSLPRLAPSKILPGTSSDSHDSRRRVGWERAQEIVPQAMQDLTARLAGLEG